MTTNLRTILALLILTTLTPSTTASTALKSEVYQLSDYPYLTACQKRCTAGEPSNQADLISLFYLTNCETRACFCPPQNEQQIGQRAQKCLETEGSGTCATVKEYNGLMAFVAKYCGFEYVPATTGLLFPPSGGATSTPGAAASCWDKYGYPVRTAGCSSGMMTATRTSDPYSRSTANSSAQQTDLPIGKGKGKGGLSLGKIIGFSVMGFFLSAVLSALGCNFVCPGFCCCC